MRPGAVAIVVDVNQHTNVAVISLGYVIRLLRSRTGGNRPTVRFVVMKKPPGSGGAALGRGHEG